MAAGELELSADAVGATVGTNLAENEIDAFAREVGLRLLTVRMAGSNVPTERGTDGRYVGATVLGLGDVVFTVLGSVGAVLSGGRDGCAPGAAEGARTLR